MRGFNLRRLRGVEGQRTEVSPVKRLRTPLIAAAALLTCAGGLQAQSRLGEGGFPARIEPLRAPQARPAATAPAPVALQRLRERLAAGPALEAPARPKAIGDRLRLSLDDDALPDFIETAMGIDGEYEARLDVSGGLAGDQDWVAVRFPARDLAGGLPVRVQGARIGLDDRNGSFVWPAVELWLEDPAAPLTPRSGADSVVAGPLDAELTLGSLPQGAWDPTRFARLEAFDPSGAGLDVPADWLSDGAFDDDFERFDQPLDDLAGLWLECEGDSCCDGGGCPFTRSLAVSSNAVARGAGTAAPTLAIRFPDPVVGDVRPAVDLDLRVSANIDVSDAAAGPAGVAVRASATDAYYAVLVDPVPSPDELVGVVVSPSGATELGRQPLVGDGGNRRISVQALGANPEVRLEVEVDGAPTATFTDDVWRWTGSFVGLVAAGTGTSGELWDDFQVERRRDVFVTIQLPPGEDAGLPLDISDSSVAWGAVLTSADGAAWTPLGVTDPAFCFNPGSPFVQLEVEKIDAAGPLFTHESRLVTIDFDCPTCPVTRNRCNANGSADERFPPVPTVGEALSVRVGWWNEHVGDDRLLLRATVLDSDCDAVGNVVASGTFVAGDVAGQAPGSNAEYSSVAGVLDFVPALEGSHCLVIEEFHDANADCCADGFEPAGPFDDPMGVGSCPGACTPAPASDSNPSTGLLVRDFNVARACTPAAATSDMDGGSLRLAKVDGTDPVFTEFLVLDDTRTVYNVHAMEGRPFDTRLCFQDFSPIFDRLVFSGPVGNEVRRTYELPAPADGRVLWLAAFETDGCPAASSLPDSSADDPGLGSCSP